MGMFIVLVITIAIVLIIGLICIVIQWIADQFAISFARELDRVLAKYFKQ